MFTQNDHVKTLSELTAVMTEQFDMMLQEGGLDEYREFFKTFMKEKYGVDSLAGMAPEKRKQLFKDAGAEWQKRKTAKGGSAPETKKPVNESYNYTKATAREFERQKSEDGYQKACDVLKEQSDSLYTDDHRYRSIYGQSLKEYKIIEPSELDVRDQKKFYENALKKFNREYGNK